MRRGLRPSGFTLVELLVVIAIVVLLVALLLPSLRSAREQSQIVRCAANLREIGIGWHAYKQDHDGEYPAEINAHRKFRVQLERYLPTAELYRCPSDQVLWPRYSGPETQNSYIMSPVLMGRRYRPDLPPAHPYNAPRLTWQELDDRVRRTRVIKPTVPDSELAIGGEYDWLLVINEPPDRHTDEYAFHNVPDTNNLLFHDGHVQFLRQYPVFYITPRYTMNPYRDLIAVAIDRELVGP